MDKQNILLNPNFNLDEALRQKENRKKQLVIVNKASESKNLLDARFDSIRSQLHGRNDGLTVVFHWEEERKIWEIGIVLPWCDVLYGIPPDDAKLDKLFADALFREWVKACGIGEKDFRMRHILTDGNIRGT